MTTIKPFRLLVCGSRWYRNTEHMAHILCILHEKRPITILGHGKARGADVMSGEWAALRGIPVEEYAVNIKLDGKWPAAGIRRNQRMLNAFKPDGAIAFYEFGYNGTGTLDMVRRLKLANVPVVEIKDPC